MRIDHWESGSQYPNGHFVRSLGQIGDLETEIKAIVVENDISVPPFSEAQVGFIKLFSCSSQRSMKFILLINVRSNNCWHFNIC